MTGAGFAAIVSRAVCLGLLIILGSGAAHARDADAEEKSPACLSGPKATAPKGERWYYRVERNTKRHCWYTRAGGGVARKEAEPAPKIAETVKPPDPPARLEPLQNSVANARAEADLSAIPKIDPQEAIPAPEPEHPAWKLAERWSEHQRPDLAEPPKLAPTSSVAIQPAPPLVIAPAVVANESEQQPDEPLYLAGLVLALLGLTTVLVAVLIRRRMASHRDVAWHFAQRAARRPDEDTIDDVDQDDALPASWRDLPRKRQREAQQMVSLRESALKGTLKLPTRPRLFAELPHQAADKV